MRKFLRPLTLFLTLTATGCQLSDPTSASMPLSRTLLSIATERKPNKARAHRRVKDGLPINNLYLKKARASKGHRAPAKTGMWSRFRRSEMPDSPRPFKLKSDGGLGNADHFRSVTLPYQSNLPSAENGIVLDFYAQHEVPWSHVTSTPAYFLPQDTTTDRIVFAPTLSGSNNCPVEITSVYALPKRELSNPEHPELGYQAAIQENFVGAWDHSITYEPGVPNWVEDTKLPMNEAFETNYLYEDNGKYYYDAEIILDDEGNWAGGIYNIQTDQLDVLLLTSDPRATPHSNGWTAYEAYFSSTAPSPALSSIEVPYFEGIGIPHPTQTNDSGDNNEDYHQFLTWDVDPNTAVSFITGWKVDACPTCN